MLLGFVASNKPELWKPGPVLNKMKEAQMINDTLILNVLSLLNEIKFEIGTLEI